MVRFFSLLVLVLFLASTQTAFAQSWISLDSSFALTSSLAFTSDDTGYAAGRGILKTTDGGRTFAKLTIPISNTSVSIVSMSWPTSTIGYAGGSSQSINGYAGYFIKTNDAGATWSVVPMDTSFLNWQIVFPTASTGYILQGAADNSGYRVIKTENGGASWKVVEALTQAIPSIAFRTANEGFIAKTRNPSGLDVIYSSDGFTTTSVRDSGLAPESLTTIYTIEPMDDGAWLISAEGKLYRTTDAGLQWTNITLPNEPYLQSMKFSHNVGFEYSVLSTPIMNRSTDYGLTWNYTILPDSGGFVKALTVPSPNRAYAIISTNAPGSGYQLIKWTSPAGIHSALRPPNAISAAYADRAITIQYPQSSESRTLRVFDLLGGECGAVVVRGGSTSVRLNVTSFREGAYFVRDGSTVAKFEILK